MQTLVGRRRPRVWVVGLRYLGSGEVLYLMMVNIGWLAIFKFYYSNVYARRYVHRNLNIAHAPYILPTKSRVW